MNTSFSLSFRRMDFLRSTYRVSASVVALLSFAILCTQMTTRVSAQEEAETESMQGVDQPIVTETFGSDEVGKIIIETRGKPPELPIIYTANSVADATVGSDRIEQTIKLIVKVVQGKPSKLSLGLRGEGEIVEVLGQGLQSWAVRREGEERFLELNATSGVTEFSCEITARSSDFELPTTRELLHLSSGESVGFDSQITVRFGAEVDGAVVAASGFAPLKSSDQTMQFQSATGGNLELSVNRLGSAAAPVELVDAKLSGEVNADGNSIQFRFEATANVTQRNVMIDILSGNAAVSVVPNEEAYRLSLATERASPLYKLLFPREGSYPIVLNFVAMLTPSDDGGRRVEFQIATGAIVPMTIRGLGPEIEFLSEQSSVMPVRRDNAWLGFLPATGAAKLQWKTARQTGEGKLFFTATGRVEANLGTGLLRQDHTIDYQVLQGELPALRLKLAGPGEILDVQGDNIIAWDVTEIAGARQLDITLSQPIKSSSRVSVRSQTVLGAFPVRIEGLRLNPMGAVRYSGFLRLTNQGLVRLEPTALLGLTQLSPEQFPGDPSGARQAFVYRFPAGDYSLSVTADRIQPEVTVAEVVLYQVAETDRVIKADVELDIREAPIRDWDFLVPQDYSIVSVTGAAVADYIAASEPVENNRNLKVIFSQDVEGRQLISLHLEKSEPAAAGDWVLPRIAYPGAKSVRGEIGVVGAPGFRINVGETELLVEKPLSYFPKPVPDLQQAFRIREPEWTATMQIELLDRSIQSDVFHLYSLSEETVYGSALINYFVTGSPVSEWNITVPESLGNVTVDGQDVRTWRREGDALLVSLHQPVMGAYTLLITFEEKPEKSNGAFKAGAVVPTGVQGERGYVQVVSPLQVELETVSISDEMLKLDPLELPAEFRLLTAAPPLGTWQYTERPFNLSLRVKWFEPGSTVTQVVEFAEANSRVSKDGELVTDVLYYVKSRGQRTLKLILPADPVRLWEVSVNGQPVTARQAGDATLIPLPGGTDPNIPVEVSLRLGKPTVDEWQPVLSLPVLTAPVLKTQWNIAGDEQHVLVPSGGTVTPPTPVLRPSGFEWIGLRGTLPLLLIGLLIGLGIWGTRSGGLRRVFGLAGFVAAIWTAGVTAARAFLETAGLQPLQLSLPVLSPGEEVVIQVDNMPAWQVDLSWIGMAVLLGGVAAVLFSFASLPAKSQKLVRLTGTVAIAVGILMQRGGAPWFFALMTLLILFAMFLPAAWTICKQVPKWCRAYIEKRNSRKKTSDAKVDPSDNDGVATTASMLAWFLLTLSGANICNAADGFLAADSVDQQWQVSSKEARLNATGTLAITGQPGDRFILLKAPGVLTRFDGPGLRLTKSEVADQGLCYIISIPILSDAKAETETDSETGSQKSADVFAAKVGRFEATFEYQLDAVRPMQGLPVLTGLAAVQHIDFSYDEAGWDVICSSAVQIDSVQDDSNDAAKVTQASVLLAPGPATLQLKPQARDVKNEATQFFVEAANLYLPGPGVVDGVHRINIRTAQGQVGEINAIVPEGLTVSSVDGPIGAWQFDADSGRLEIEIEPPQSQNFSLRVETQRGLDPLPVDLNLAPLRVEDSAGEVGLLGIAFGSEAQPEKLESTGMSPVNLGDFDSSLMENRQAVLQRVYRYGAEAGTLDARVAPVDSEVRVSSQQVLSLGDERIVLSVNFSVEIARSGLFQLSFSLPDGLEVESLSGVALHHWSELIDGDQRQIVLHLNGKTLGLQNFSLTLSGNAPTGESDWQLPRFQLNESTRQTGELVVKPTTGIRLRTVSRQNVSETDPRTLGGGAQGALAFRLLQRDWDLVLGIEKLDPWIIGQVLHEVTLREGQTRTTVLANFNVQNASIRSLQVALPITDADEIKTLRASGETVSDFIRTAPDSNVWEVLFKRRVVGKVDFRIEYERRGDRENESEEVSPVEFPEARQSSYYVAIRAGGRLQLEHDSLTPGWQRVDWNTLPTSLRDAENRNAPMFAFRSATPADPLVIRAQRHSLADSLKLRIAKGNLTTVLSPTGDQLTSVEVSIEVIQRSSLNVGLPTGGDLFSIFVNGESVNSIRQGGTSNAWQFYILPGIDDRTAKVRFVYSVPGDRLSKLKLSSPELNVPLENIEWNIVVPKGYELYDSDGNLELTNREDQQDYDRSFYLSKVSGKRQVQAKQAADLLQQANQLLQAGEQTKARWAFNSVANQYALDAASNEDARVQLENLQTQQAIVGLNTRRQRLYLDNKRSDATLGYNDQLGEAAAGNPILQQDQLNFRPQELSQLLQGNTTEDNAVLQQIAGRLVQHQHTTDPAPQAIIISLPEEGTVYTFSRTVQVAENAPLELDLKFRLQNQLRWWQMLLVGFSLVLITVLFGFSATRKIA